MLKITEEMKELLKGNLCYIATATPDGMPCVAPKSCRFTEEGMPYFTEWAGKKTYGNLLANPRVAISTTSQDKKTSFRFEGEAKVLTDGPLFESESRRRIEKGKRPVVAIVVVDVKAVYEMGKRDHGPGGLIELPEQS